MNKSDFSKARVGDKVWSPFGPECAEGGTNGKIISVWGDNSIVVVFDNGKEISFLRTGGHFMWDSFPSCFHCRPHIEIPPPPRRTKWVEVEVGPYLHQGVIKLQNTPFSMCVIPCGLPQTVKVEVYDE